jgi:hypothetical protein
MCIGSIGDFELEILGKLGTKWDKTSNCLTKIKWSVKLWVMFFFSFFLGSIL